MPSEARHALLTSLPLAFTLSVRETVMAPTHPSRSCDTNNAQLHPDPRVGARFMAPGLSPAMWVRSRQPVQSIARRFAFTRPWLP